jgi:methionine sulfoxide reductase heme-binding subunit
MPAGPRFRRRLGHHAGVVAAALLVGLLVPVLFPRADLRTRLSLGTAYLGLGCVALSLVIGPLHLLRGRPNPVSSDLRRDLGIWGGVAGLAHTAVGLTVHMRGKMQLYFLPPPERHAALPVRLDGFGLANYMGLLASGVLLLLVLLSSDLALGRLGSARWKRWQRLNYLGAAAILGHGVAYMLLERRAVPLAALLAAVSGATLVLQWLGFRRFRRDATT